MDFTIGELHPNTPHLFADLAELVLTIGYNGRTKLHKNDLLNIIETGTISPDELDIEAEAEEEADSMGQTSAEKNGRHENQLEDVLTQLAYRSNALNDYYPFTVDGDELVLLDKESLTDKQRVYRFLLACSRLRSFNQSGGIRQKWAKAFTCLSKLAMEGLVPNHATVRIFDANSEDRKSHYSTDLRNALKILGKDLAVLRIHDHECDKAGTSGDAGLDLVAVVNFDDGAATSFALLGQCGAQESKWPQKTLEAHAIRYRNYFQMQFDYPGIMFTPVCYRTADGEWADNQSANGILLIDRERILKLLDLQNRWQEVVVLQWFLDFEARFDSVKAPG
ncbi:MAG: hypothetical protein ACNA7G_10090 [Methylobacter sp.]